jgi:hypothetical protein
LTSSRRPLPNARPITRARTTSRTVTERGVGAHRTVGPSAATVSAEPLCGCRHPRRVSGAGEWGRGVRHCGRARQACRLANGLLIRRCGLRRRAGSLSGRWALERRAQGRFGPADAAEGHGSRVRSSPPSDTSSPTPDTLTECVGFCGFRGLSAQCSYLEWWNGPVIAAPRPTQPRSRLGWSQACSAAKSVVLQTAC